MKMLDVCFWVSSGDLIIGVLSILVTVLMGWNIFQIIDFKAERKNLNDLISNFKKELNEKLENLNKRETAFFHIANSIALNNVLNIKEIKDVEEKIKRKNRNLYTTITKTPTNTDNCYYVEVYEDTETHITIFGRYKVDITNCKVYKEDFDTGNYKEINEI